MKINNIYSLFIGLMILLVASCDPIVDEQFLENTTDIDGVELSVTQSTPGGNEITLEMFTPGITGYWNYMIGKGLTNRTTIIYPVTGSFDFKYNGTLGAELFEKTAPVTIEVLDHPVPPEWEALLSSDAVTGKTWVFAGTDPRKEGSDLYWYMSPPGDPGAWETVWWNAGGCCIGDDNGKMKFDLDGDANFTYESGPGATPEVGTFVLDLANQALKVIGPNILGGANPGEGGYNPSGVYTIISLTEDEMILYYADAQWNSGWTWKFRPE